MSTDTRFQRVIEEFLARARAGGERSITFARFVLASLLVVRMLVVGPPLRHGAPRDWLLLGVLLVVMAVSLVVDRKVTSASRGRHSTIIGVSVVSDAVCVGVALAALAVWPYPGYTGLVHSPSLAFTFMAIAGSALRFSLPLVLGSLAANGAALGAVLLYESFGPHPHPVQLEELLTVGILFAGTATLSIGIVVRGRKLIGQGSKALFRAERAAQTLGAYISSEVAEQALADLELKLGGTRLPVTCLFSDLRGFTSYSETLPPEQLVAEVNAYLEAMVTAIATEGGVIDKFIGDAVMVVFGVPKTRGDDARRAIRTARAMQRAIAKHNVDRRAQGLPSLVQGIGIHSGPAVVGNVGTAERMQHTVMGSVVNIASRLEAATKELHVAVLISAATVEAAQAHGGSLPALRALPPVQVRGVREPLPVYCFPDDGFSMQHALPDLGDISEP